MSTVNASAVILENIFNNILDNVKFTEAQKKELFTTLEESIKLNFLNNFLNELSTDQKRNILEKKFENKDDILKHITELAGKEKVDSLLQKSTIEVIGNFLDKLTAK